MNGRQEGAVGRDLPPWTNNALIAGLIVLVVGAVGSAILSGSDELAPAPQPPPASSSLSPSTMATSPPPATSPTSGGGEETPGPGSDGVQSAPSVRNSGRIKIGDEILDLDARDRKWGAITPPDDPDSYPDNSLQYGGSGNISVFMSTLALPGGTKATYGTCSNGTGYQESDGQLQASALERDNVCFRLDNGRYGTLRVVDLANDSITLDITTWELA